MKKSVSPKSFAFGLAVGLIPGIVLSIAGCGSLQQTTKTAKDAVKLAEDACVLIRDVAPDNKQGQEICAKEEELRPFIKLILGSRAKAAAARDAGTD